MDAAVFLALIVSGIAILARRHVSVRLIVRENMWLTFFFVYCLLAVFWSDVPFVAAKRWFKTLGHPVMALIILTEPDPVASFRTLMKRCGYLLLSLSVLFIKYFPQYGRGFDSWTGQAMNRGINLNKNELGYVCLVFGLFFLWNLTVSGDEEDSRNRRSERILSCLFLAGVVWLLARAGSASSGVALACGTAIVMATSWKPFRVADMRVVLLACLALAGVCEVTFNLHTAVLHFLGRNSTLTDRTAVWSDALSLSNSPVFGAGFESFWTGKRLEILWSKWWWHPNQAHDGYLETYLNLGMIGVTLLSGLLLATFSRVSKLLKLGDPFPRFRMAFLLATVVYNFSEATFKGVALVWTIFHLIAIDLPAEAVPETAPDAEIEDELPGTLAAEVTATQS